MKIPKDLAKEVQLAFESDATVLLTGPTGCGKTRLARFIHENSVRKHKPFVAINLATLHEGTLESELFGHEKGAFTGAAERRVGRLEAAQGGTVFLDEVAELSPRLQSRLLDFLQSRVICPVGGNREIRLDTRIIAATNKNLESAVKKGEFREDLFHRLRVISIQLKSLIERADDFDEILHACLEELCQLNRRSIYKIAEEVARCFENYDWPGNYRELRNVLEYAVLACRGTEIQATHLPPWFLESRAMQSSLDEKKAGSGSPRLLGVTEFPMTLDFQESLSRFEREYLQRALQYFRGRINRTAQGIGMNKTTLLRRVRAYGLELKA